MPHTPNVPMSVLISPEERKGLRVACEFVSVDE
jgi:hypothetical protein